MSHPLRTLSQLLAGHRRLTFGAAALGAVVLTLSLPAAALAATPAVDTFDILSTGATTATVEGDVNPEGQATKYQVQYALAGDDWCTSFGATGSPSTTTLTDLNFTDDNYHGVDVDLTGLTANTGYCAQLVATNGDGTGVGGQEPWTQGTPVAETFDAFSTGQTTATIEGDINPSGQSTSYQVEWDLGSSDWCTSGGTTSSPAHTTSSTPLGSSDTSFHSVSPGLTGLTGGTQYCAQLIATNGSGEGDGGVVTWTQGIPGAFTLTSSSTGATTATVDGDVNPAGQTTHYAAWYALATDDWCTSGGVTGTPTKTTATTLGFTDNNLHEVTVNLTGLTAATQYCAELVATNASGEGDGGQVTWTEGTPSADTTDGSSTGATTATVEGDVNPAGQTTQYKVEYGLSSSDWCTSDGTSGSPDSTSTAATLGSTDTSFHDVSVNLTTGLVAGMQYCAEMVATNASGEGDGFQVTWTQGLPTAFTDDAFSTGATTATVEGEINPSGQSTSYVVQYDLASSGWCTSGGTTGSPAHTVSGGAFTFTDTTFHNVSVDLTTNLTAGTQYCAQVEATNGSGKSDGGTVAWTEGAPNADTLDGLSTGLTTAKIDGDVNPSGLSTTYKVAYSLASTDWCTSGGNTGSPGSFTTATALGSTDTAFHDVTVNLTGLAAKTSYCAAVVATNAAGTATGGQVQWTQGAPSADTTDAESTGATTATVSGDVNPSGQSTTYQAAYDLDSSQWCQSGGFLGSPAHSTTAATLPQTDGTFHDVTVNLTGLIPSTAYCGAIVATNGSGTTQSFPESWTQLSSTPQHTLTVSRVGSGVGTVTSSPAGISCGATCSANFDTGTQVTLTAAASAGSTFAGWSGGGCSGTGTCTVTLNADTAVTATFNTTPPVAHTLTVSPAGTGSGTVTSSPAGIDCGATCSHTFAAGTQVTLTAISATGSGFVGWSGGGCSGAGNCVVTLNADTTVTATFQAGPASPPSTKCIVPKVTGKKLSAAKSSIKSHHCSVGKITKVKSSASKRGKVISQSPKPGKHLAKGSKVALKVGK